VIDISAAVPHRYRHGGVAPAHGNDYDNVMTMTLCHNVMTLSLTLNFVHVQCHDIVLVHEHMYT